MAEILSVAGGALLTVVFEGLLKKLELKFIQSQDLSTDVLDKLKSWRTKLPKLQALLVDAEEKQMFNPNSNYMLKKWLVEIKDLAYDMEDVLDEFDIDAQRKELINPPPSQASSSKFILSCFSCFNAKGSDFIFDPEIISKVDDIAGRLLQIEEDSKLLGLVGSENQGGKRTAFGGLPPTTSLPELHVYGRENEKAAILQKLLDSEGSSNGFSVVPILGMGGVGKTTLARLVYNEVEPGSFDLKAWVCVSDKFDIPSITRTFLEAVGGSCVSNDLNLLQRALQDQLSNKKFLLVLDDIWNENFLLWDNLHRPFLSGAAGSKIIATTRNKRVVEIMAGSKDSGHRLELLKYEHCLSIFAQVTLGQNNFDQHLNLKEVGEKLVSRCKGLPLAAKTLGGILRGKLDRHDQWEHILYSKIWELPENESDILPALRLSYLHLPSYLKPCFAFCAMFPKDYKFDKEELVLLWMAGGILKEPSEEAGHRYFDELVSRAFFQQLNRDESHFYVMHDLIHDLAQFIAGEMCFDVERMLGVEEKSKVNCEKVRHLSFQPQYYDVSKRFEFLKAMKSLRTFLPATSLERSRYGFWGYLSNEVVHDWLPNLKCLRALSLEGYQIVKLPDSINDLKHLTHLNLGRTAIKVLPESVGNLVRLQSLLLRDCWSFQKFPENIGNLIDLHHVDIRGTHSLKEMPLGMCKLKSIVTMSKFIVGKTNELLKLYHLENFSQLRGELAILDLHNVLDADDARRASLGKIVGLDELILEWTSDFSDSRNEGNIELQVLGWLKPHRNLKSLEIISYGGRKLSSWIGDPSFKHMSKLELRYCKNCTSLPSLGLLPALKKLFVGGMDAVKVVGREFFGLNGTFPVLVELVFEDMLNWEEWTCSTEVFPCLSKLEVRKCPMLIGELPSQLSSLVELVIEECPKLRSFDHSSLPSCQELQIRDCEAISTVDLTYFSRLESLEIERCSSLKCIAGGKIPTTLKSLKIKACENLESLPNGVPVQGNFRASHNNLDSSEIVELQSITTCSSLKEFEVGDCNKLKSLSEGMLQHCTALESITIGGYEILKSFLSLESSLSSLERLKMYGIDGCETLPEMGLSFPNLKYLKMNGSSSIECIPDGGLPPNLSELYIWGCKNLKSLPKLGLSTPNLERIEIQSCPAIECMPDGVFPPNLSALRIWGCEKLNSFPDGVFPPNLSMLGIYGFENLNSLPDTLGLLESLQRLLINHCKNLKTLPKSMYSLTSLKELSIQDCPGIECIAADGRWPPNLAKLDLSNCENLKSLPNTVCELTSLQELSIGNGNLMAGSGWNLRSLTSLSRIIIKKACPPELLLPSSVTYVYIEDLENEEWIPKELFQNLNSLQELYVEKCLKLQSLPKEAMPPSLRSLSINKCPLLKRHRFEAKGDLWPLARNIPYFLIDLHQVDTSP